MHLNQSTLIRSVTKTIVPLGATVSFSSRSGKLTDPPSVERPPSLTVPDRVATPLTFPPGRLEKLTPSVMSMASVVA